MLSVDWGNERDAGQRDIVGYILISMDMFFMIISFFCLFAVAMVLRNVLTDAEQKELAMSGDLTKISPDFKGRVLGSNELFMARSKWGKFDHKLAMQHAKVEQTEEQTQRSHDAVMKVVEEKKRKAHNRLMGRVKKRNTMKSNSPLIKAMVAPLSAANARELVLDDKQSEMKKTETLGLEPVVEEEGGVGEGEEEEEEQRKREEVVERVRATMKKKIVSMTKLHSIYSRLDIEHSGMLTKDEFQKLIQVVLKKKIGGKGLDLIWNHAWANRKHGENDEMDATTMGEWLRVEDVQE